MFHTCLFTYLTLPLFSCFARTFFLFYKGHTHAPLQIVLPSLQGNSQKLLQVQELRKRIKLKNKSFMVPLGGIEPPYIPYERIVLPLNYRGIGRRTGIEHGP